VKNYDIFLVELLRRVIKPAQNDRFLVRILKGES